MNRPTTTKTLASLVMLIATIQASEVSAKDSDVNSLGNTIGATDYYKVECASSDTDHFKLSIIDKTPITPPAPQLLNAVITKDTLSTQASTVKAQETQAVSLAGGTGKYLVSINTDGTNTALTKAQTYKYQYQCIYNDGLQTKLAKSAAKSIKNGKTTKINIACAAKKKTKKTAAVEVNYLAFTITNTSKLPTASASAIILNGQLTKDGYTTNTSDSNGDNSYSPAVSIAPKTGSGSYFIAVDNTGTNQDNAKLYAFQYSCLNKANQETATADAELIQDQ